MDSSKGRPVRVLWGYFSDTVPTLIQSRKEFDSACQRNNVEIIHWCFGKRTENTLNYFLPMLYEQESSHKYLKWAQGYEQRLPSLQNVDLVVAYVVDHFKLINECFSPDVFVSWNKHDPIFGLPYELANQLGLTVFDTERSLIPRWISLGFDFKSGRQQIPNDFEEKGRQILEKYPSAHIRKQWQAGFKPASRNSRTVLVLGSWDAVTDTSANIYEDSQRIASQLASDLPDWKIVFKPHPLATTQIESTSNLRISTTDPIKLINHSDVVVTSGTKLELDVIQSKKPLVLCGGGFLANCRAARVCTTHTATLEAINTNDDWHNPEDSMKALAEYVGYEASHSWYSLDQSTDETQTLDDLLLKFAEVEANNHDRQNLASCALNYHSEFVNRYHWSGIGDFKNHELLSELAKRVKIKLSMGN